ncbi:MAG TPA: UPF0175 family protein [Phycisphaerae bacterium]|jgi:predicted HTH domain antitoxin|nr:UPF0175 family protein [Phycisphaerae bacterium]HOB74193.1 UPF0175 family protein [Phycisphaerae bacterium]HOJ54981.1 UPF0175 family protein [Phycisphaerae bacterium]HOL26998.1 UPF0175 family protein [Phycisphaerae bacterium]HPP21427.1 UPF0175 family protein [Phycisphaerae bacterium]
MTLSIDLPEESEAILCEAFGEGLSQAAKEGLIIEGCRTGRLTLGEVRMLLGLQTRIQAEEWLGKRGVCWNYGVEDLEADRKTLSRLFNVEL